MYQIKKNLSFAFSNKIFKSMCASKHSQTNKHQSISQIQTQTYTDRDCRRDTTSAKKMASGGNTMRHHKFTFLYLIKPKTPYLANFICFTSSWFLFCRSYTICI